MKTDFIEVVKSQNKALGKKFFMKSLVCTAIVAAIFCGYVEHVKAKFNTNIIGNFAHLQWVIGELMTSPPTDFSLPAGNSAAWSPLNVELANLLSQAIISPLAAIIERGIRQGGGGRAGVAATSTALATNFIANPPAANLAIAPMIIPQGGGAAALAAFNAALGSGPVAVAAAVAAAVNNVPQGQCQQEFTACAILMLGAAKAVHSIPFPLPIGLTASSIKAAGAAAVATGVGGPTLGSVFRTAVGANVATSARNLVEAYVVGPSAVPVVAHGAAIFGAAGLNEAYKLHSHLAERGHFWRRAVGLPPALSEDRHFLAWARAARSTLDTQVPPNHSSFVVPPAPQANVVSAAAIANGVVAGSGLNALVHLHSLLAAANTVYTVAAANTCLSWNGACKNASNSTQPLALLAAQLTALPAPNNSVGIHLDVSAAPQPVGGTVIKCDLRGQSAGGFLLSNSLLRSLAGNAGATQAQNQMADAAVALGEAAASAQLVGGGMAINYLLPLPSTAVPVPNQEATPGALTPTGRITILINRNDGTGTLFAE